MVGLLAAKLADIHMWEVTCYLSRAIFGVLFRCWILGARFLSMSTAIPYGCPMMRFFDSLNPEQSRREGGVERWLLTLARLDLRWP